MVSDVSNVMMPASSDGQYNEASGETQCAGKEQDKTENPYESCMVAELVSAEPFTGCGDIHGRAGNPLDRMESKLDLVIRMLSTAGEKRSQVRGSKVDHDEEVVTESVDEAANNGTWTMGKMTKFLGGFGFVSVKGQDVFVHASQIKGGIGNVVGQMMVMKVERDVARGEGKYRASRAERETDWKAAQAAVATRKKAE